MSDGKDDAIQLFEDQKIRTAWDAEQEQWYFSVVDVISVLTEQKTARSASTYWAVLKKRLREEGASELLTNCKQLKMTAADGKKRLTDVANTEQLLRIIQSVPSPPNRRKSQQKTAALGNRTECGCFAVV
jgi:maltooligosyltrehalose synthase